MNTKVIVRIVILAATTLAVSPTLADRVPINIKTRTIEDNHIVIDVTDSQALEMDTQGSLTLTEEQWTKVRQSGLVWPMRIEGIVDYNTDGCGCFTMEPHAIRLSKNKVGMLTGGSDTDFDSILSGASEGWGDMDTTMLRADFHGQFYAKGILVPFPKLLEHFQKPIKQQEPPIKRGLRVSLPIDIGRNDPVVKDRLDRLFAAAKASGWTVIEPGAKQD